MMALQIMSTVAEKTHQLGVFHGLPWWWHPQELPLEQAQNPSDKLLERHNAERLFLHLSFSRLRNKNVAAALRNIWLLGWLDIFFHLHFNGLLHVVGVPKVSDCSSLSHIQVAKKVGFLIAPVYLEAQCQARLSSKALRLSISSSSSYPKRSIAPAHVPPKILEQNCRKKAGKPWWFLIIFGTIMVFLCFCSWSFFLWACKKYSNDIFLAKQGCCFYGGDLSTHSGAS